MKFSVDINCDLGEGFGNYKISNEKEILPLISSCNIACGFHAGDPDVISETIQLAIQNNVKIGAHPSYPDLQGFGRRKMYMKPEELRASMLYQVSAVKGMVESFGGKINHVKPHGALYNYAAKDFDTANIICEAIRQIDKELIYMGMPNSCHQEAAQKLDHPFRREGFGDRKYDEEGMLVSRSLRGSVLNGPKEVSDQIVQMVVEHKVTTISGKEIELEVDSICIHGDNPNVLDILNHLHIELSKHDITIKAN